MLYGCAVCPYGNSGHQRVKGEFWFASVAVDCHNAFALITKRIGEKEKMYAFCIIEQVANGNKEDFLTCLSKAICSNMCRTDYVS